jgi:uncharacterized membrane protein YgdD (TMEM256/DUF423 family)
MNPKSTIAIGSIFSFLAVLLGAFAAHGLKDMLEVSALHSFQTGVTYQFTHAFGMILTGILFLVRAPNPSDKLSPLIPMFFFFGILLFSFSLYVLSVTGMKILGIITPFGGISFLIGWALMARYTFKSF